MSSKGSLSHPSLLILTCIGIVFLLWLPRWPALDRFVTVDEPLWLMRSANFNLALSQHNFAETFQREHPGVTTMAAGMLGIMRRYPEYTQATNNYWKNPNRLDVFLRAHQHSSIALLEAGRQFMVLAILLASGLAFYPTTRLLGLIPALIGFLLVAFDPFSIAFSRVLHLDGLLSALMLTSIISYLFYLEQPHSKWGLLLSAITAGSGWLTKSPAFFLIPWVGLVTIISWLQSGKSRITQPKMWFSDLLHQFSPYFLWLLIATIAFVGLWPSMWVDPLTTLQRVFTQATGYAISGHEHGTFFYGQIFEPGQTVWYFYILAYLWRSSPFTLLGLIFTILSFIFPRTFPLESGQKKIIYYLGSFVILFTVFISLSTKQFDRYMLPVFGPLNLIAACGYNGQFQFIKKRVQTLQPARFYRLLPAMAIILFIAGQVWMVQRHFPYYFDYFNPVMGGSPKAVQAMLVGWGEGLDQAAQYLDQLPQANKLRVLSWYSVGCFSYFFSGQHTGLEFSSRLDDLAQADYAVIYIHQWQRQVPSKEFLDYFRQLDPIYVVKIGGIDYARVYKLR